MGEARKKRVGRLAPAGGERDSHHKESEGMVPAGRIRALGGVERWGELPLRKSSRPRNRKMAGGERGRRKKS